MSHHYQLIGIAILLLVVVAILFYFYWLHYVSKNRHTSWCLAGIGVFILLVFAIVLIAMFCGKLRKNPGLDIAIMIGIILVVSNPLLCLGAPWAAIVVIILLFILGSFYRGKEYESS